MIIKREFACIFEQKTISEKIDRIMAHCVTCTLCIYMHVLGEGEKAVISKQESFSTTLIESFFFCIYSNCSLSKIYELNGRN